ncbi:hypothetical protein TCON_2017 [Astathelohania contejeani]|uniref:Uncharacterized protein n=1 Tax=Astathelohania contejeani TaxID=164912 RepID=A0ABQ7HX76_9MICR|nr:hypothetical protein TCON_2017 [Thelohania contejeani]
MIFMFAKNYSKNMDDALEHYENNKRDHLSLFKLRNYDRENLVILDKNYKRYISILLNHADDSNIMNIMNDITEKYISCKSEINKNNKAQIIIINDKNVHENENNSVGNFIAWLFIAFVLTIIFIISFKIFKYIFSSAIVS